MREGTRLERILTTARAEDAEDAIGDDEDVQPLVEDDQELIHGGRARRTEERRKSKWSAFEVGEPEDGASGDLSEGDAVRTARSGSDYHDGMHHGRAHPSVRADLGGGIVLVREYRS